MFPGLRKTTKSHFKTLFDYNRSAEPTCIQHMDSSNSPASQSAPADTEYDSDPNLDLNEDITHLLKDFRSVRKDYEEEKRRRSDSVL